LSVIMVHCMHVWKCQDETIMCYEFLKLKLLLKKPLSDSAVPRMDKVLCSIFNTVRKQTKGLSACF
jgi:hypothetical protein